MNLTSISQKVGGMSYNFYNPCAVRTPNITIHVSSVIGDSGTIGGALSHEFHILADVGEDDLRVCRTCRQGHNAEVSEKHESVQKCSSLDGSHDWVNRKGIEVSGLGTFPKLQIAMFFRLRNVIS